MSDLEEKNNRIIEKAKKEFNYAKSLSLEQNKFNISTMHRRCYLSRYGNAVFISYY